MKATNIIEVDWLALGRDGMISVAAVVIVTPELPRQGVPTFRVSRSVAAATLRLPLETAIGCGSHPLPGLSSALNSLRDSPDELNAPDSPLRRAAWVQLVKYDGHVSAVKFRACPGCHLHHFLETVGGQANLEEHMVLNRLPKSMRCLRARRWHLWSWA